MKNYLCEYVKFLLNENKIDIKDAKTTSYLTDSIENIIFNVVSIAAIITYINNSKTIEKESIQIITKYLTKMCGDTTKITKGGGGSIVLPSEFYGVDSLRYSPANAMSDILKVDFDNMIARPQIGGGKKKVKCNNKPIEIAIKEIVDYYKLTVSTAIIKKILKLIENYIKCLISQVKMIKGKISTSSIKKLMKSSKFFEIFK